MIALLPFINGQYNFTVINIKYPRDIGNKTITDNQYKYVISMAQIDPQFQHLSNHLVYLIEVDRNDLSATENLLFFDAVLHDEMLKNHPAIQNILYSHLVLSAKLNREKILAIYCPKAQANTSWLIYSYHHGNDCEPVQQFIHTIKELNSEFLDTMIFSRSFVNRELKSESVFESNRLSSS